ncbi:MAG: GreA/GreB family elongation factor [Minisyncoccales bacterium]
MLEEKNFYLTRQGLKKIKKEYEELKQIKLSKTKGEAPAILVSEDVNPEYIALQEDLGLLDIRLAEIEVILKNASIIKNPAKTAQASVGLGATVLVNINGKDSKFTIVGTLEADPDRGMISNESPVGKTLLGKKIGDLIKIDPSGKINYKIKKIAYNIS